MTTSSRRRYTTAIAAASLIVGPLLMTVGDLMHPAERMDPAAQVTILLEEASSWYAAHLLLFIGMLLFIPGILAIARLAEARKPAAGHAARILTLMAIATFSAIFVFEMLLGRFMLDGADAAAATALLETFQSVQVFGALAPVALAFFAGIGLLLFALAQGPFRWSARILALGSIFIFGEIASSEVILSQIGNLLILLGSIQFAWLIVRHEPASGVA